MAAFAADAADDRPCLDDRGAALSDCEQEHFGVPTWSLIRSKQPPF
jgi:hypothetical protein